MSDEQPDAGHIGPVGAGGLSDAKADELIRSNNRLAQASEDFALATVEYQERGRLAAQRYRSTLKVVVAGFSVVTLVLLAGLITVVTLVLINNNTAADARARLLDCIQPSGTCYRQGQVRTASLIGQLERQSLLQSVCAAGFAELPIGQRVIATERCVAAQLQG